MANIIDRRLNPRDKTIKNRQKFIQRGREQIKKAVKEQIDQGNIADIEHDKARVRVKGIDEPEFQIDPATGNKRYVLPGNEHFVVGDRQDKPKGGEGSGGRQGGLGRSEDDFEFVLNRDEYLDFIFEDLELPDLIKKQIKDVTKVKPKRSGFKNSGNPNQLDVVRSLKNSLGRRIGLNRPKNEEIEQLEQQLEAAERSGNSTLVIELQEQLEQLRHRQTVIPWLDPFDVRYRNFVNVPQPMTQAVMFCVMDVSGSMRQKEKDLAKRFFLLLHMFLRRKYQTVKIIFVKHHEEAFEVDEDDFFQSRESGGTVVSTAIRLVKEIIDKRFNINDWNIYVAQVSDGDNFPLDQENIVTAMRSLLPLTQYFAYVELHDDVVTRQHYSDLWMQYRELEKEFSYMQMREANDVTDIWKVFKELFSKEKTQ